MNSKDKRNWNRWINECIKDPEITKKSEQWVDFPGRFHYTPNLSVGNGSNSANSQHTMVGCGRPPICNARRVDRTNRTGGVKDTWSTNLFFRLCRFPSLNSGTNWMGLRTRCSGKMRDWICRKMEFNHSVTRKAVSNIKRNTNYILSDRLNALMAECRC